MTAKKFAVFSFAAGLIGLLAAVYADTPQYAVVAGAVLIYSAVLFWQVYKLNKQIGEAEYRTRAEKLKAEAEAEESAQALLHTHNKIQKEKDKGEKSLVAARDKHEDEIKKLQEQTQADKKQHETEASKLNEQLLSARQVVDYYAKKDGLDVYTGSAALRGIAGIYVVKNMDVNAQNKVKIGETGNFAQRFRQLESATHSAGIAAITPQLLAPLDEGRKEVEQNIHKELSLHQSSNEWFNISPERAMAVVCAHVFDKRMSNLQQREGFPLMTPPDLSRTPVLDIIKKERLILMEDSDLHDELKPIAEHLRFESVDSSWVGIRNDLDGILTNEDRRFDPADVDDKGYVKGEAVVRALLAENPKSAKNPAPYWSVGERRRIRQFAQSIETITEIATKGSPGSPQKFSHTLIRNWDADMVARLEDLEIDEISLCEAILYDSYSPEEIGFLASMDAGYNEQDDEGHNPLRLAIKIGKTEVALELIKAGVMMDVDGYGRTVLHHCAMNGAETIVVKALIASGLDVNAVDSFGDTALDIAREQGEDIMAGEIEYAGGVNKAAKKETG